jgi:ribonuclease P protein component
MFERLRTRREFLAVAKGHRKAARAFVLEAVRRVGDGGAPRFGFTVSKRVAAKAVERNRIRRRLREAVRLSGAAHARPGHDYVLVGRRAALTAPFRDLTSALADAMRRVPDPAVPAAAKPAERDRR